MDAVCEVAAGLFEVGPSDEPKRGDKGVVADVEAVLGDVVACEPAGNFLLGFGGPQVALADVVGGTDPGVGGEPALLR